MKARFEYAKQKTGAISFPLGGIGTGSIGLAGNGRLIDWEIFNRPNKNSVNGFSHIAVKAEADGKLVDARVLNGDLNAPYTGQGMKNFHGYGFGPPRYSMAGVPHFKDHTFIGEYPMATIEFQDEKFPGDVKLTSFNPFIPLNEDDSSIPGAFFEIEIHNTSERVLDYTVNFAVGNPVNDDRRSNEYQEKEGIHSITMRTDKFNEDEKEFGSITLATDSEEISRQDYWYRGMWFDSLEIYWRNFTQPGKWINRMYEPVQILDKPNTYWENDHCSLAAHFKLQPGERKSVKFVISWHYPNCSNYWTSVPVGEEKSMIWKNFYATLFDNSKETAHFALKQWGRLYKETLLFKETFFRSTLQKSVLDAVSANMSILKSPTVFRLTDGSFYGFEGVHSTEGSCEGSCTHVWNYAYALPFLFPKLERSMRDLDFMYNQREDGRMSFRLQLPIGKRADVRGCADGQFGGVIKAYRDWKISGNRQWLESNWLAIKKSIEYAWAASNEDKWDADKDGVLEGRQHHTLDMELFGPNSWLNGFYLAALKAGAEMADYLGEPNTAAEYRELFVKGKAWTDKHLFNGEYYYQLVDLKDRSILEKYDESALSNYWNSETEELKYQIAEGCAIDQVLAQWHANISGLGEVFDPKQTKKALQSIYNNNFKKNMRNVFNPCRLYSLNDEAGVMICEWPENKYKPMVPLTYAQETMNGFEYQVAIHMIQEGLVDEGLEIVTAIRDRFDGEKRNPWNEFECGSNYSRSMASYSLLLALSGFKFNMSEGMIGFSPVQTPEEFNCFWSLDSGWGEFISKDKTMEVVVLYGELNVQTLKLPLNTNASYEVIFDSEKVDFQNTSQGLIFMKPIRLGRDQKLIVREVI